MKLILAFALALCSLAAGAQTLTPQQRATLAADIAANPALVALRDSGNLGGLAGHYNALASPAFAVERTSLSRHEILTAVSSTGSTFAWAGAGYITRSQGERDAFREMFNSTGSVNPSLPSIKAAFSDIFSGAGGATNRAHIAALAKRQATRFEKLFASGTGSDASPATLGADAGGAVIEGQISPSIFEGLQ